VAGFASQFAEVTHRAIPTSLDESTPIPCSWPQPQDRREDWQCFNA